MRFIFRYTTSFTRSRRRISFLFTTASLLSVALVLFIINNNRETKILSPKVTNVHQVNPSKNLTTSPQNSQKSAWPIDEKGRSLKNHFLVLDFTGFFGAGASEGQRIRCPSSDTTFISTRQHNRIDEIDFIVSHDGQSAIPFDQLRIDKDKQQYSMAFVMESEVHSSTGAGWARFNFKMTYNLDDSYPEPATYFDMHPYIIDLLKPPVVSFENKEKSADIVWIITNCNAHNGREGFIQRLMQLMKVDSYGACLNNRQGYGSRMSDNVDAYIKYKFVIAIENSNCMDYVTEKLVKAVESGSIPVVAGLNGRPDYRRYLPEHSYINIFDYASVQDLADDLKRIANNKTLYESYLWYKKHDKDLTKLREASLEEKLKQVGDVIGANTTMLVSGIAAKEKSENKVCKLIRFVRQTPWEEIKAHKKTPRADPSIACLPGKYILTHFDAPPKKNSQP